MSVKNRGDDMQPEFDVHTSESPPVNYSTPRTGGKIQDDLRQLADADGQPGSRQTLGDPEDYSNAASDDTANTPVKARSSPPREEA